MGPEFASAGTGVISKSSLKCETNQFCTSFYPAGRKKDQKIGIIVKDVLLSLEIM